MVQRSLDEPHTLFQVQFRVSLPSALNASLIAYAKDAREKADVLSQKAVYINDIKCAIYQASLGCVFDTQFFIILHTDLASSTCVRQDCK